MKIAPAIGIQYLIYRSLIESRLNYLAIVYAHFGNNTSLKSLQIMQLHNTYYIMQEIGIFKSF